MNIQEAELYFGNLSKLCRAIGHTTQAATHWRRQGYIPMLQQYRIERLTEGKLKADIVAPDPIRCSVEREKHVCALCGK